MFALRRAAITAGVAVKTARPAAATRPFSVLGARLSAHPPSTGSADTSLIGPGGKPAEVPTDLEQATGLERLELLAKLDGKEFFDMAPLEMTRLGTKQNPIIISSKDDYRFVGCTGFPADSHDTIWLTVKQDHEFDRCPECGCVYKLDGVASSGHGHH